MTTATADRLRNLKMGWRVRLTPKNGDDPIEGTISEVSDVGFRLGIDPADGEEGDGTSMFFGLENGLICDLMILDADNEIIPDHREKLPETSKAKYAASLGADLDPEDPVKSDPSGNAVIADRPDGYLEVDEEGVVLDADGRAIRAERAALLDDQAVADAEAARFASLSVPGLNRARRAPDPLLCTLHLPIDMHKIGVILTAIGDEFPDAYVDTTVQDGGPDNEMRIRTRED